MTQVNNVTVAVDGLQVSAVLGDEIATPFVTSGVSATTTLGSATAFPGTGVAADGEQAIAFVGTVIITPFVVTGVSGTTAVGTVTVPNTDVSATGNTATGAVGTATFTPFVITGVEGTGAVGTPTTFNLGHTVNVFDSFSADTALGSVLVTGGVTSPVPVTGVAGTTGLGDEGASGNISTAVTGLSATVSLGLFRVVTVHATGVVGTGEVGTLKVQSSIDLSAIATFTTVEGSTLVTVNHNNHGAQNDDALTISETSFGTGVYTDLVTLLNGDFIITKINDSTYNITIPSAAPHSVVAGGEANFEYEVRPGLDEVVGGFGWGAGTWGRNGWNEPASVSAESKLRLWKHDNFGEDLIFNVRGGGIFYWDAGQGLSVRAKSIQFFSSSAPTVANQVLVSDRDRHVIAVGTNAIGSTTLDPLLVRFSSQESPFDWTPTATNTAGDLRIGNGSEIVQAVETRREILLITDSSVHSMQFIGPPFTFGITQLSNQTTIRGSNAAVAVGDAVFWMGVDRFYLYDGRVQPLPCTVRDHVFENFNELQANKVYAGSNAAFGEVFWFYPSNAGSENDQYVVYNYEQKIWYFGSLERTAWLDRGINQFPIATTSYSNTEYPSALYDHERGTDADGEALPAFIESAPIDIGDGDNFAFIRRMIPDVDFGKSTSTATKEAVLTLKAQRFPGSGFTSSKAITVTDSTEQNHTRLRGRSFGLRIESANSGVAWRLGSPRLEIQQDGKR